MGLLGVIAAGFVAGLFVSHVSWPDALGGLVPRFEGPGTVLLAASMLGATVMPHAVYVHSSLVRDRHGARAATDLGRLVRATRGDVIASLLVAGTVNIAMLLLAASSLAGVEGVDTIPGAHDALTRALGPVVGVLFGVGLLASGVEKEALARGVLDSIASRAAGMLQRVGARGPVLFTGGLARCAPLLRMLERKTGLEFRSSEHSQTAGALGAAVLGAMKARVG